MRLPLKRYFPDWAPIPLRLALGTVLMANGWLKINAPLGITAEFDTVAWGWPNPVFWAWVVALVETFGGLLIIVGLFTRTAATLIALVMILTIWTMRIGEGFVGGFEFHFALLMIAIALTVGGPGHFSVDNDVLGRPAVPRKERAVTTDD